MKFALLLLIGALSALTDAAVVQDVKSHDLTLGTVGEDDWIIWSREIKESGSWFPWKTVSTTFNFTVPSTPSTEGILITAVRATDKGAIGKGGYPKLVSGGVGSDHVTIDFASQKWQGIDFLVVIYGKVPK